MVVKNYPEVLGHDIKVMPLRFRSSEWFERVAPEVREMFWKTLGQYNATVAAEYLRDNHEESSEPKSEAATSRKKSRRRSIVRVFDKPLDIEGTVIGKLWPHGITIYLPDGKPKCYSWTKHTPNWAFVGFVEYQGEVSAPVSRDRHTACLRARNLAQRLVNGGAKVEDISVRLYALKLEQAEMIGNIGRVDHGR
jgi:hypothetical protein